MHQKLEITGLSIAIMSPSVTPSTYADYLSRVLIMHRDAEATVFKAVAPVITDVDLRKKTMCILEDLKQLNEAPVVLTKIFLDKEYRRDLNFNLGLMYVTEGSVLGGQVILKNIRKALGKNAPGQFLNVYGEHTGALWKNFLNGLTMHAYGSNEQEQKEIIDGAIYGFERAHAVFN